MRIVFLFLYFFLFFCSAVQSQQRKMAVGVSKVGEGKVKIEWINPYGDSIVQLNVQRSWDSARNYLTVFVPLSPELPRNGFIDETHGYSGMYYRIFYVLADGSYFFTRGMKTSSGSDLTSQIPEDKATDKNFLVTVHDDDTVIAQLNYEQYKKFRDSIVYYTKDTLFSLSDADVLLRYYDNNIHWIPSSHIFTNTDGYVQISLADALQKKYSLRFFDENHKFLFGIKNITQAQLLLDKTDFMRSGWFYFELTEDNKVKERNKFYIPKDF
ncbi:MAG TPA: hypothetical protein VFW07_24205 [Parafilimonas sp.]|nr:hypothetical protein [Parafilimonas sp.]